MPQSLFLNSLHLCLFFFSFFKWKNVNVLVVVHQPIQNHDLGLQNLSSNFKIPRAWPVVRGYHMICIKCQIVSKAFLAFDYDQVVIDGVVVLFIMMVKQAKTSLWVQSIRFFGAKRRTPP